MFNAYQRGFTERRQAAGIGPARFSSRRLVPLLPMLLLIPIAAFGAVANSASLRVRQVKQAHQLSVLDNAAGVFRGEHLLEQVVVGNPGTYRAYRPALVGVDGGVAYETSALRQASASPGEVERMRQAVLVGLAGYASGSRQLVSLLDNHKTSAARVLFRAQLAPQFEQLIAVMGRATSAENRAVQESADSAYTGNMLGYGLAALLIVLVVLRVLLVGRRAERARNQEILSDAEGRYERLVDAALEGVWSLDRENRTSFVNPAMATLVGHDADELVGSDAYALLAPGEETKLHGILGLLRRGITSRREMQLKRADGRPVWVLLASSPMHDSHGSYIGALAMVSDIDERKQMETRLRHLADHDPLSGLYNRRRLIAELDVHLQHAGKEGNGGAVLTLDLDNFKLANDTYGHATGDAVLKATADALTDRIRKSDTAARLGGDEFALVLPGATEDDAIRIAREIRACLCERRIGPPIMTSIGIAMFCADQVLTADEVLVCADVALYEAKEQGGDQERVYRGEATGALSWVKRIQSAIVQDQFVLYGQPIIELKTRAIKHHELLIRMVGEGGDLIPPGVFLPTAERFGVIRQIDEWVTAAALRIAAKGFPVAVNLSASSIGQEHLLSLVRSAVANGLDPKLVMFEVTETAAMTNMHAAREFAEKLNAIGCDLALDDFGTGFGSFTYLKHLPAQYLKIDIEFIRGAKWSATDREIVSAMVGIAHTLGKVTIAEGVEDAETLEMLERLGVDYAQGFHIGLPAPLDPAANRSSPHLTLIASSRKAHAQPA